MASVKNKTKMSQERNNRVNAENKLRSEVYNELHQLARTEKRPKPSKSLISRLIDRIKGR